ncbi:hypothetical protein E3J48_08230 [Candidatus Aerophobetes bacterium]|uniref:Uncharacterized protein n=1 Tax=Aerophobetes bacterium TaxID=2030807 RepID=A0A523VWL6_UNCAE|nr:MAG: hypothetical protein E3J48_08230 [Candidatus Aerophobetes bacterium]
MEGVKTEGKWEELILSLQQIQTKLEKIGKEPIFRERTDVDRLSKLMNDLVMVVHNLFLKLEKPAEEK